MHHATPKTMHNTMLRRKTKNFIGPYGPTVINKYLDNGLTLVSCTPVTMHNTILKKFKKYIKLINYYTFDSLYW